MSSTRRRKEPEEHENLERWLISYSDFMTLLVAFFVVMYAISSVNEGKYRVLSEALMHVFTHVPVAAAPIEIPHGSNSIPLLRPPQIRPNPPQIIDRPVMESAPLQSLLDSIRKALAPLIKEGKVRVEMNRYGIIVHINADVLFPTGSDLMTVEAIPIISRLGVLLQAVKNPIEVQGYTDNRPIHTSKFPSNWSLSVARAVTVVTLFRVLGVNPSDMVAAGYGKYHPIATNATATGRARNRRVDVVILAKALGSYREWPLTADFGSTSDN